MSARSLPLGVDIGSSRIRVAQAIHGKNRPLLRAVAVRELNSESIANGVIADVDYVAAVIEDAVSELSTRERRCVGAISAPHAFLKPLKLPPMSASEREKAAHFEARRYIDGHFGDAVVRIRPIDRQDNLWALGIARKTALQSRVNAIKRAGLHIEAIDDEGLALRRAFPASDVVIDVGQYQTKVHAAKLSQTLHTYCGGDDISAAIARDLGIDAQSAEKRKRILGTAGAGERARLELAKAIASLMTQLSAISFERSVAWVGNGARLGGLAHDLQSATGRRYESIVSHLFHEGPYPRDVLAAAAPDWTLAVALAMRL